MCKVIAIANQKGGDVYKRQITESSKALDRCRGDVSELIRVIASGKTYADDYFKKTFDSLLSQTCLLYTSGRNCDVK